MKRAVGYVQSLIRQPLLLFPTNLDDCVAFQESHFITGNHATCLTVLVNNSESWHTLLFPSLFFSFTATLTLGSCGLRAVEGSTAGSEF